MKTLHSLPLAGLLVAFAASGDGLVTPAIEGVVAAGATIELIKEGFQGTEGPIALPDGAVIFTEAQVNASRASGPTTRSRRFWKTPTARTALRSTPPAN